MYCLETGFACSPQRGVDAFLQIVLYFIPMISVFLTENLIIFSCWCSLSLAIITYIFLLVPLLVLQLQYISNFVPVSFTFFPCVLIIYCHSLSFLFMWVSFSFFVVPISHFFNNSSYSSPCSFFLLYINYLMCSLVVIPSGKLEFHSLQRSPAMLFYTLFMRLYMIYLGSLLPF